MRRWMRLIPATRVWLCSAGLGFLPAVTAQDVRPHAGMLRHPDVSATQIVFVYADDLWLAPREGGAATPLASPAGEESFPRFSPDGKSIAFVGNYDGNRDIYTVPVTGGVPRRVTHHPSAEWICDWTADGRLLFNQIGLAGLTRQRELYTVSAEGGLPIKLPVPYGATASISADGQWLAYTPHSIDTRTWKRYRGGMQTDIWLFDLKAAAAGNGVAKQITDWEGTDSLPMFHAGKVYYLSDQGAKHRNDIWSYDVKSGERKQITQYADFDAKWPSIGPGADGGGEIILQCGSELRLLDLKTGKDRAVTITIPGARPKLRSQSLSVAGAVSSFDLSPSGKRGVFEARGDIWDAPARHGSGRLVAGGSAAAERNPIWSPDGKHIAYLSDAGGEYEIFLAAADGKTPARQLTRDGTCYRYLQSWSPDSRWILFNDKTGAMYLCDVESGANKLVDKDPWANTMGATWSQDSQWIVYTRSGDNQQTSLWLYHVPEGKKEQLTSGMFSASSPAFDRKGEYLYYVSAQQLSDPIYEDLGTTFAYANTQRILVVPLRADLDSPLAPKSDEEGADDKKDKDDKKDENSKKDEKSDESKTGAAADTNETPASSQAAESQPANAKPKPEPVRIDVEGFERRAVLLPIERGRFGGLFVTDAGHLLYVRSSAAGGEPSLKIYDVNDDERKEKTVADGVFSYALSADGKKLLLRKGDTFAVVDAAADQKLDKPVSLADLQATIDPRTEWAQMFREAWRVQRDFFYVANMHGVDWNKIRQQYEAMLADCASRTDVGYVISEMISELNVGHAYYFGGPTENEPSRSVGMLGCDFELYTGPMAGGPAYRISQIHEGAPWDSDARGPLSQPNVNVKVGDFLLAVNGRPLDVTQSPWAAFQGLADRTVSLLVSDKPARDETARTVVVKLLSGDTDLRYRAWIERNRKYVEEKSGGKVGYIYVPNTGVDGQNDLFRQFYGQLDKAALLIDDRWNGGGQIPTRFIELLNRPRTNYWARRDGRDWPWPPDSHQGPKAMLINGLAGSGGDMFPWLFRFNKLGKLVGMRTWGGLVGISGNPNLIDGAGVTAPTFGFYETDGTWGVEGHGVDPDGEVIDDPGKMLGGADPQMDAAIALLLKEIETSGYKPPKRPADPDRSGMGIRPEDK